ncbi:MAG: serine/threonine protein kinase [Gemmataceae bacterium]|nr:serine/threonine protein kinase [Gemmataceae bacterium]
MQIQTPESLVQALRDSRLYAAEEMTALASELATLGDDPQVLMRHLIQTRRITLYQLRKVIHGKSSELFIGPYIVLDKLGEGGMGRVYRARQTRLGRVVAIKVVRAHLLSNPIVRGRYEREVLAAAALSHPNIVSVFDAGVDDGRYYLEMEFVDGIDLARLIRAHGVLSVPEACEYLRQAALGLHHAHEQGFVHRDIKPSNIVVSGERHVPAATEPACVKILDMGLVRAVGFEEEAGGTDLTRDGTVVGTPDYMAPEQAKNSSTVDRRADLYSLGGTFYFLLTGKPPFPVGSPIEKILKHQLDPPPPLQAARPDVPAGLAQIVARLMAKKPADRFATAGDLANALAPLTRFTSGAEEIRARPAPNTGALAAETLPPSSITVPPLLPPPSTIETPSPQAEEMPCLPPGGAGPGSQGVSATDATPRPSDRNPSGRKNRRPPEAGRRRAKPPPPPDPAVRTSHALIVVAGVVAVLIALGILGLVAAVAFGR